MKKVCIVLALLSVAITASADRGESPECRGALITDKAEIEALVAAWNDSVSHQQNIAITAEWAWASNLTDFNLAEKTKQNAELAVLLKNVWSQAVCVRCTAETCSEQNARTVMFYQSIDTSALPAEIFDEYMYVQSTMEDIYGKAKVCRKVKTGTECLPLEPDLTQIIAKSRDGCELQWAWEGWRNESGRKMRGYFTSYVHLQNEAARANGFKNAKDMWTKAYQWDEVQFFQQVEAAWQKVKPLYEQLHAFVRGRLRAAFKDVQFPASGQIPAHLLGNMWAQDWNGIAEFVVPDPTAEAIDITQLLLNNNVNETDLYHLSDEFFQSIGFEPMTSDFWKNSILLKPTDREMICHASAWDFYKLTDFRIKQCTTVTSSQFQTVHHEMGHIQYFMEYKDQPIEFRNGANPGFHEAIGDLIALSVMTPDHLKAIGLLPKDKVIAEGTYLNSLMNMALKKIVFVPFGYLLDQYRWKVFEKDTDFNHLNEDWWKIRCQLQGISSPVARSEEDFDPGAKYHVPASVPYIRYFFSHIVQFQFHKSICVRKNHTAELHKCDIYNDKEASAALREAMALGQSIPYPQTLKLITGTDKLDAEPFLEYFKPLSDFLANANAKSGERVGWDNTCSPPPANKCTYDWSGPTEAPPTNPPPITNPPPTAPPCNFATSTVASLAVLFVTLAVALF